MTRSDLLDEATRRVLPKFMGSDNLLYIVTQRVGSMHIWEDLEPPVVTAIRKEFHRLAPWANSAAFRGQN